MEGLSSRGIVYVASQDLCFLCDAIASAETAKKYAPDIPICLFTDIEDLADQRIAPFDEVIMVGHVPDEVTGDWAAGLLVKVRSLALSPYDQTLFLDSDTRVLSDEVRSAFDLLSKSSLAAVPCTAENSRSCALYGPMFNTGVMAYRRDASAGIFKQWEEIQRANMDLARANPPGSTPKIAHLGDDDRRFLLINDQTSFAQLISPTRRPSGLSVLALDDRWNARNYPESALHGVIIDHANRHKIEPDDVETFLRIRGMLK